MRICIEPDRKFFKKFGMSAGFLTIQTLNQYGPSPQCFVPDLPLLCADRPRCFAPPFVGRSIQVTKRPRSIVGKVGGVFGAAIIVIEDAILSNSVVINSRAGTRFTG
jgi:hypothetical protein